MRAFISYSHKDSSALDRLHTHLAVLKREGTISQWYDREILAGEEFDKEIATQLASSDLFLALVSPDFLASDYCYDRELKQAIERHDRETMRMIPIILEPCDWQATPLQKFKVLPRDGKPISEWTNANAAFHNVVKELRRLAAAAPRTAAPSAPAAVKFEIRLDQKFDDSGEFVGEGLPHGEAEALVLAQEIINARNAGKTIGFDVRHAEAAAILEQKEQVESAGPVDLEQRGRLASWEHRLQELGYSALMVQRRLEILFHPGLMKQLPDYAHHYASRIVGVLELMATRSGFSSSYEVEVRHARRPLRMSGPLSDAEWQDEGLARYLARSGGASDYIANVYSRLRDRRCLPLMVDLIAQTMFVSPTDREFGSYGPLVATDDLFNLENWRASAF